LSVHNEFSFDDDSSEFADLIAAARSGSDEAIGELIENCRGYLLVVANQDLDHGLRGKIGASDIVQETMMSAQIAISDFRGESYDEFVGWLRSILVNDLRETRRKFRGTEKRQVDRELPLVGDSQVGVPLSELVEQLATPGSQAIAKEEARALTDAMDRLSDEYRQVLELRHWQQLSFVDVGQQMGRSADAARKLWARAILVLQQELDVDGQSC